MRLLKNRSRGLYLCFVLLCTFVIGGSVMAHANSGTGATAIVKAGSLSESPSDTKESLTLTLSKKAQLASYSLPITVTDARGSGAGWNLTITSMTFTMKSGKNTYQLPTNASSISGVSRACSAKSTCTLPNDSISYPLTIPAGTSPPPPPVKFFNAAKSTGLGHFLLTMMVNVSIPANTVAGTYSSTIILAIANGP